MTACGVAPSLRRTEYLLPAACGVPPPHGVRSTSSLRRTELRSAPLPTRRHSTCRSLPPLNRSPCPCPPPLRGLLVRSLPRPSRFSSGDSTGSAPSRLQASRATAQFSCAAALLDSSRMLKRCLQRGLISSPRGSVICHLLHSNMQRHITNNHKLS